MEALYVGMSARACDGCPHSDRPLPLWAELAVLRQARKVRAEYEEGLGKPVMLIVRTHYDEDGEICAHIADRAYRVTWGGVKLKRRNGPGYIEPE